mmetsp:Transcript_85513/g.151322  ORF Transcript_85513/g.151322 Transcript_85513/m.151322 type:complete len:1357 (-) Transcript_85513:177-4247(-)
MSTHDGQKPRSLLAAIAAAFINFMLMFGMCAAYGMIIFQADRHAAHRALGVKMCLSSAFVGGGLMAMLSGIPIAIGGSDLNPAVFYGTFVDVIAADLSSQLELESSYEEHQLSASTASADEFCVGQHLSNHREGCASYHEQLRATTIFAVASSTALLGITYFTLGKLKLTRYMSLVPLSITEAFLSCIGYKVFSYALSFCDNEPVLFMTAATLGLLLYFCKALHIGNPSIVLPLGMVIPLAAFWIVASTTGTSMEQLRESKLLFTRMEDEPFYYVWTDSIAKPHQINFVAWSKTFPDLLVMLIVCTLDCALKLRATESKLPVKPDPDSEIMLFGLLNGPVACCGGAATYMQLKFNVISFGVMRNTEDRRAGLLHALMCGACYFISIEHFNYLPRPFLSALLYMAGAGFVTENLWGSRKYLHLSEWLEIVAILAVFILSGQLILAVLAGILLAGVSFIFKYAQVPSIAGHPLKGNEIITRERPVGEVAHQSMMGIAADWLLIIRLKGYVFFSSSQPILKCVEAHFKDEDEKSIPPYRRLKYIIFNAKILDGMDASGALTMLKIKRMASERGARVLWSNVEETLAAELKFRDLLETEDRFDDLDSAVGFVERMILSYKADQQAQWRSIHESFGRDAKLMIQRIHFEPFREIFLSEGARMGCPWRYCSRKRIKKFETVLCRKGDLNRPLYLIHSGAVACWEGSADKEKLRSVRRHGWFLNSQAAFGQPSAGDAVAVEDGEILCWSKEQWWHMASERPLMMMELMKAVMRQEIIFRQEQDLDFLVQVENEEPFAFEKDDHKSDRHPSFNRQPSEDSLATPYDLSNVFHRDAVKTLPQLQSRLTDMHIANSLGELGFFEPKGDTVLPKLPQVLRDDLMVAFFTFAELQDGNADTDSTCSFSETGPSGADGRAYEKEGFRSILPKSRVIDALLHAGIFHVLEEEVCDQDLLLQDFLSLGHECHLARLDSAHVLQIQWLCSRHDKGTGQFAVVETAHMLKALFGVEFDVGINDAVLQCWGPETWPETHVSTEQFIGIVSWYVKRRERDWKLLQGIFHVLGTANLGADLQAVRLKQLLEPLSSADASPFSPEEMIWAADWIRNCEGEGQTLDPCGLLTVFLTNFQIDSIKLPPAPVLLESAVRKAAEWQDILGSTPPTSAEEASRYPGWYEIMSLQASPKDVVVNLHEDAAPLEPNWAQVLLNLLDKPSSSQAAYRAYQCMASVVALSALCICLEPLLSGKYTEQSQDEKDMWLAADVFFATVFSMEVLLRFSATFALHPQLSTGFAFLARPQNLLDLVAVTEIFFDHFLDLAILRTLYLDRIPRLVRLSKVMRLANNNRSALAPLTAVIMMIMGTNLLYGKDK